jgi:WD40 repeat protein
MQGVKRTSGLMAPIMQLVGHGSEVLAARFSPTGEVIASGSADKCIFMWRTYGECENYMMLSGHKNAILELSWFQDGARIVSCSADKSVRGWDVEVGQQIKRVNEHTGIVNSVSTLRRGSPLFVSGGDDKAIKVGARRVGSDSSCVARTGALVACWLCTSPGGLLALHLPFKPASASSNHHCPVSTPAATSSHSHRPLLPHSPSPISVVHTQLHAPLCRCGTCASSAAPAA